MYDLASIVVALHQRDAVQANAAGLGELSVDERLEVEERAAVLEFDAGMGRHDATRTALTACLQTRRRPPKQNR
jgi:hypothetical protein